MDRLTTPHHHLSLHPLMFRSLQRVLHRLNQCQLHPSPCILLIFLWLPLFPGHQLMHLQGLLLRPHVVDHHLPHREHNLNFQHVIQQQLLRLLLPAKLQAQDSQWHLRPLLLLQLLHHTL